MKRGGSRPKRNGRRKPKRRNAGRQPKRRGGGKKPKRRDGKKRRRREEQKEKAQEARRRKEEEDAQRRRADEARASQAAAAAARHPSLLTRTFNLRSSDALRSSPSTGTRFCASPTLPSGVPMRLTSPIRSRKSRRKPDRYWERTSVSSGRRPKTADILSPAKASCASYPGWMGWRSIRPSADSCGLKVSTAKTSGCARTNQWTGVSLAAPSQFSMEASCSPKCS